MNDAAYPPQSALDSAPGSLKPKRTFWQWFWTIVVMLIGAFIGFVIAMMVALSSGLIELTAC